MPPATYRSPPRARPPRAPLPLALALLCSACGASPPAAPVPGPTAAQRTEPAQQLRSEAPLAAAAGGGLHVAADHPAIRVTLRDCTPGEVLEAGPDGWTCTPATSHPHAELATPGTLNAEGNPLHFTRLRGVPDGLADGADDEGVLRVRTEWLLAPADAGEGESVVIAVAPENAAPRGHEHQRPACAQGYSSFDFVSHRLCVSWQQGLDSWSGAARRAAEDGARLCSLAQLQRACENGYREAIGAALRDRFGGRAWLRDRTADNMALLVNSDTCANLEGEGTTGGDAGILPGAFWCVEHAAP